jgi:SSS family solute:Na+ symporter
MSTIDLSIFILYFIAMIGVGIYYMKKNKNDEDYFVGGRSMGKWHIGLSVVATDVGGGFSIGLGGLGFTIGLSGSWMLFTGLLGAWLSATLLIPKIYKLSVLKNLLTFPQIFKSFYGNKVALVAAIISVIGYLGFTSSQLLAGAKLTSATFDSVSTDGALIVMGVIAIAYTVMGGLKAVIYTDTIQWLILIIGLFVIGLPFAYYSVGGWDAIVSVVPPEMLSLSNITWVQMVNWCITIVPIWFIGMTLYQRIYASKSESEAKKAWYIAGIFEWPIMATMGVVLGLLAKVALEKGMLAGIEPGTLIDAEKGLPLLLKNILPVGLLGIMLSAYFSAILSTADSCLMAASGSFVTDILQKIMHIDPKVILRISQLMTLILGLLALTIAFYLTNVLDVMLMSYAFMVSGLLMPVLGVLFWKNPSTIAALLSMIIGGTTTVLLIAFAVNLPFGLDANFFGLSLSALTFISLNPLFPNKRNYT